jgi:hypothetical protein
MLFSSNLAIGNWPPGLMLVTGCYSRLFQEGTADKYHRCQIVDFSTNQSCFLCRGRTVYTSCHVRPGWRDCEPPYWFPQIDSLDLTPIWNQIYQEISNPRVDIVFHKVSLVKLHKIYCQLWWRVSRSYLHGKIRDCWRTHCSIYFTVLYWIVAQAVSVSVLCDSVDSFML